MLDNYFLPVEKPKDGNLVVYTIARGMCVSDATGVFHEGICHLRIYRETEPNWNSHAGGSIESKWGTSQYVYQHDVFFAPDHYGSVVSFYQLQGPEYFLPFDVF